MILVATVARHNAGFDCIAAAEGVRAGSAVGHAVLEDNPSSGHGIEIGHLIARIEGLVQELLVGPLA